MATPTRPPVVLFEGPPSERAAPAGWRPRQGFSLPDAPWDLAERRWACVGTIDGAAQAAGAIEALSRGVGLVVAVRVDGDLRHRTLEDLHHLGDVRAGATDGDLATVLDPVQRDLIAALAAGATVTGAAEALHLSRRTANRRLADLRARLGVDSNAEAISRWVAQRHDPALIPPPTRPT